MSLSFAGRLDHQEVLDVVDQLVGLVAAREVASGWDRESALSGMTVGGLTRHLVSQPECAVEFLALTPPAVAPVLSLTDYYAGTDWLHAPVDAPENTSIRDDFNRMATPGQAESVAVLAAARDALPATLASAGEHTFVPWQNCSLQTDDFLVCRLLEILVHADDLAISVGLATPTFADEAVEPVVALLAVLAARRHGLDPVLQTLARAERAGGSVSAFGVAD